MGSFTLPTGFIEQRLEKATWWIKVDWAPVIQKRLIEGVSNSTFLGAEHQTPTVTAFAGGRGPIQRIEINTHEAIIVRRYHRGGFVRHFIRDIYWDYPPRPFVELNCMEEARRRGVTTVEVLGAKVEWLVGGLYRGLLVTQEAGGFHNLWSWLQIEKSSERRQQMLTVVAQAVATMHQAGIAHADLNPTNILVDFEKRIPSVVIIDFDRAQLFSGSIPLKIRTANLRRFQRYVAKYDTRQEWLTPTEFEHFHQAYETLWELQKKRTNS